MFLLKRFSCSKLFVIFLLPSSPEKFDETEQRFIGRCENNFPRFQVKLPVDLTLTMINVSPFEYLT